MHRDSRHDREPVGGDFIQPAKFAVYRSIRGQETNPAIPLAPPGRRAGGKLLGRLFWPPGGPRGLPWIKDGPQPACEEARGER